MSLFCFYSQRNHSWLKRLDSPGYCTVGEPTPAAHSFSLPSSICSNEADEDHTISPYASFTSLSERVAPILSGWLDKLSPQGYAPAGLLLSSHLLTSCCLLTDCFCPLSVLSSRFVLPHVFVCVSRCSLFCPLLTLFQFLDSLPCGLLSEWRTSTLLQAFQMSKNDKTKYMLR